MFVLGQRPSDAADVEAVPPVCASNSPALLVHLPFNVRFRISVAGATGIRRQASPATRIRYLSEIVVPERRLFTIGHSNHTDAHFVDLLRQHEIDVLVDVRTQPYSQYSPQFNREALQREVVAAGRQYLFLGEELGGRPPETDCYDDEGHVLYSTLARIPRFLGGIERVEKGIQKCRVALMCSEEGRFVSGARNGNWSSQWLTEIVTGFSTDR